MKRVFGLSLAIVAMGAMLMACSKDNDDITKKNDGFDDITRKNDGFCKVTFDMQGHGEPISMLIQKDSLIKEPSPKPADQPYYRFDGWFTDKDCAYRNKWNFNHTVSSDTTLYAKWTEHKVIVIYTSYFGCPGFLVTHCQGNTIEMTCSSYDGYRVSRHIEQMCSSDSDTSWINIQDYLPKTAIRNYRVIWETREPWDYDTIENVCIDIQTSQSWK